MESTNPKDLIGSKKINLFLVPPASKIYQALAMENGAVKYGAYNWRKKKVLFSIYMSALERHLDALKDGEWLAEDSGVPHLGHMLANVGIIVDAYESGCLIDDRPVPGSAARLIKQWTKETKNVTARKIKRIRKSRNSNR